MPDYMTLMGAEDVKSAGRQMSSAADQMSRAASNLDESLRQHQRWMDDWLQRFEAALESNSPRTKTVSLSADDLHALTKRS